MNKKVMTLAEQKGVMLNILKVFSDFCDQNGLSYFLDAGTLIGAVRHKGFIPWDDDVDVCMPMKDYDRFIELMRLSNGVLADNIIVEFPENILYPFLKITDTRTILIEFPEKNPMEVGVYIDVFPKYGVRDNSWKSQLACWISEQINNIKWFSHYSILAWQRPGHNFLLRAIALTGEHTMANAKWPARLQNWYLHLYAKRNPIEKCRYVTTMTNGEFHKIAPKECFAGFKLSLFEGHQFRIPVGYDNYLHCLYKGDYMQLPPENERIHHTTIVYWK
jgi:lipopolysaccharide cholinephosphotransferase